MTDQSIFDGKQEQENNQATPENANTPEKQSNDTGGSQEPQEAFADLLARVRNENGVPKYDSVPKALEGLAHAQEYIPQLKTQLSAKDEEIEKLKLELEKRRSAEEVLEGIATSTKEQEATPAPNALNEEAVTSLVQRALADREQKETTKNNIQSVASFMKESFGDKAEEVFYGKGAELGLSREALNTMSATQPSVVKALFGNVRKENVPDVSTSSFNSMSFDPKKENLLSRPEKSIMGGAQTSDVNEERVRAARMVEELHSNGMTVHDLSDPKVYFKHFGK